MSNKRLSLWFLLSAFVAVSCNQQPGIKADSTNSTSSEKPISKGYDVGNGGGGLIWVGNNMKIQKAKLIDYLEGTASHMKASYSLGGSSLSYQEKVSFVLKELEKFDPKRSELLRKNAEDFFQNARFDPEMPIFKVTRDWGPLAHPMEFIENNICPAFTQFAIQQRNTDSGKVEYFVNKILWDFLDENNRAGLVLHEAIYTETLKLGQKDSKCAQYFNAMISADKFPDTPQKSFDDDSLWVFNPPGNEEVDCSYLFRRPF